MIKKIDFDLTTPKGQNYISIPLMLAKGYLKSDIITFFEYLENNNYGKFDRGSIGYGKFGKFFPNNDCPTKMEFEIEIKKRGKAKKML